MNERRISWNLTSFMLTMSIALSGGEALHAQAPVEDTDSSGMVKLTDASILNQLHEEGTASVMVLLAGDSELEKRGLAKERNKARLRAQVKELLASMLDNGPLRDLRVTQQLQIKHRYQSVAAFAARVDAVALRALHNHHGVRSIEPDLQCSVHRIEGKALMNVQPAFDAGYAGNGLAVAIVDTGIDYNHSELGGGGFPNLKVIGGFDIGDNDSDPVDCQGHGTACAGIAAGSVNGVASNAKLYALKIVSNCGTTASFSEIVAAWDWCIQHQNDGQNNPIMIISTSFGGGEYSGDCDISFPTGAAMAAACNTAGITLFASSGNDAFCDAIGRPACLSDVIAVGAVYDDNIGVGSFCLEDDSSCVAVPSCPSNPSKDWRCDDPATTEDQVACYSNSAIFLDLFAPSHCANTPTSGGGYASSFGGTSAACPYAAGAGALLQENRKVVLGSLYTPAELRAAMAGAGDLITDSKANPPVTKPRVNVGSALIGTPSLDNGSVQPPSGSDVTLFTFEVTYTDPTGDGPVMRTVEISPDGGASWTPYGMDHVDGSLETGALYRRVLQFPVGSYTHRFHFLAGDQTTHLYWPDQNGAGGPTVSSLDALQVDFWSEPEGPDAYQSGDYPSFYWEARTPNGELCCDCELQLYITPPNPYVTPIPVSCGRWEYGTPNVPASNWQFGCDCYTFLASATHPDYASGQAIREFHTCPPCPPPCPAVIIDPLTVSPHTIVPGCGSVDIDYCLNVDARVTIWVKDADGLPVATLLDAVDRAQGCWSDVWDGQGLDGLPVPEGDYTVEIEAIHLDPSHPMVRFGPVGSGPGNIAKVRGLVFHEGSLYILSRDALGDVKVVAYDNDLNWMHDWTVPVHSGQTDAVANPMGMTVDAEGLLYILSYKDVALRVNAWNPDPSESQLSFHCELAGSINSAPHEPDFAPIAYHPFAEQILAWQEESQVPDDKVFVYGEPCGPFVCNLDPSPGINQYAGASGMAVDGEEKVWVASGSLLHRFDHCGALIDTVQDVYPHMRIAARYGRLLYWMIGSEIQVHDLLGTYLTAYCLDATSWISEEERFFVAPEGRYVYSVGRQCGQEGDSLKLVRIQDCNSATSRTEAISVVRGAISVTEPNGGECWASGTTECVTWATCGTVENTSIRLYDGDDEVPGISPLAECIVSSGEYCWDVPPTLPPGQSYRIRVEDCQDPTTIYDFSDAPFDVACGPVVVCGDGTCDQGENCDNCFEDCGYPASCGNGVCESQCDEDPCNCEQDCPGCCNDDDCDDGDLCTDDSCDPVGGCVNEPIDCDDGDACTDDSCEPANGCVNAAIDCDDGNPCTDDSCNPASGCAHVPIDCDDGNVCTDDACDPLTGCVNTNVPAGTPCGNPTDTDCDDPDTCDGSGNCQDNLEPDGTLCPDGLVCNGAENCQAGVCTPGTPIPGCCKLDAQCDNNDVCDGIETCVDNICVLGTPLDCDDGDPCTDDTCVDSTCQHELLTDDDDEDGEPNCNDGCPDDPNKTSPGQCGCGVPEGTCGGGGGGGGGGNPPPPIFPVELVVLTTSDGTIVVEVSVGPDGLMSGTFDISNTGDTPIQFEIIDWPEWLGLEPTAGTIPLGGTFTIVIRLIEERQSINARLPQSTSVTQTGTITLSSNGAAKEFPIEVTYEMYELMLQVQGPGSIAVTPDLTGYPTGTSVTLTATPESDFRFTNWSGDAGGTDNPLTITMHADKNITAIFQRILRFTIDVMVVPEDGGSVNRSPNQASYADGTEVTLTAISQEVFQFVRWSGDVDSTSNPLTVTVKEDLAVVAEFEEVPVCTTDDDCDDGRFCNGLERCVNDICTTGPDPCDSNETCDEIDDRCEPVTDPAQVDDGTTLDPPIPGTGPCGACGPMAPAMILMLLGLIALRVAGPHRSGRRQP